MKGGGYLTLAELVNNVFQFRSAILLPLLALTGLVTAECKPNELPALTRVAKDVAEDGGGDWPEWGGTAAKNMVSTATGIPTDFDPGKIKGSSGEIDMATTKHLVWAARIGSQSHCAPTIAGGKVLIGTNNEVPRDKKHVGERGILMCFDEKTGEFLWQLVVPKLGSGAVKNLDQSGICSSPLIHGNRAYVVTNRCQAACLDLDGFANGNDGPFKDEAAYVLKPYQPPVELGKTDADIIWLFDMRTELGVFPHSVSSSSPTIIDGKLVVTTSNGTDWSHLNVPGPEAPCLITLDPDTGELIGEEAAGIARDTLHCNWSSPAVASIDGKPTIFFGGGDGFAYSFYTKAVENEKGFVVFPQNWRIDCNPPEYRVDPKGEKRKYGTVGGPSEIVATPVLYDGHVYLATGQDPEHGEGAGMLSCINATTGERVWENKEIERTASSPSIVDGLVYIADFRGRVHSIDAKSGEIYWSFDTGSHIWGSTLVVDGKVLVGNEAGEIIILAAAKTKQEIARIEFDAPIIATPVVANGKLYITTQKHVFAFAKQPTPAAK